MRSVGLRRSLRTAERLRGRASPCHDNLIYEYCQDCTQNAPNVRASARPRLVARVGRFSWLLRLNSCKTEKHLTPPKIHKQTHATRHAKSEEVKNGDETLMRPSERWFPPFRESTCSAATRTPRFDETLPPRLGFNSGPLSEHGDDHP